MTVSTSLKSIYYKSSPGIDGIPAEFYKVFWDDLKLVLVESFNESFKNGILTSTQRKSVISLIFKKGDKYCNFPLLWVAVSLL